MIFWNMLCAKVEIEKKNEKFLIFRHKHGVKVVESSRSVLRFYYNFGVVRNLEIPYHMNSHTSM